MNWKFRHNFLRKMNGKTEIVRS